MDCMNFMAFRRAEDDFEQSKINGKDAFALRWLLFLRQTEYGKTFMYTALNKERRISTKGKTYSLDGYCVFHKKRIGIEIDGCFWHGHECELTANSDPEEMRKRREDTRIRNEAIRATGLLDELKVWNECEILKKIRESDWIEGYIDKYIKILPRVVKKRMTEAEMIEFIRTGAIFGFIEFDGHVDDADLVKFRNFPPFFIKDQIGVEDVDEKSAQFALKTKRLTATRKSESLVAKMVVEKHVVNTTLFNFYLSQGIIITKVHTVLQFGETGYPFKTWLERIQQNRRFADANGQPLKGLVNKLLG